MPCHQSNGGFKSGVTLCKRLAKLTDLTVWSVWGEMYYGHREILEATGAKVCDAKPVASISEGDHVFFYMNDYPAVFGNFRQQWQAELSKAASIQLAFNRVLGGIPAENWLAEKATAIFFLDGKMQNDWSAIVKRNELCQIPMHVLAPPVELDAFTAISKLETPGKLIFSRLAGDGDVCAKSIEIYQTLASKLPNAEFWFMPTPQELLSEFSDNPQFRFLAPNQIPVTEFFANTDIFMLTYKDSVPIPGTRCLVEAMAAGCAPLVVNREGPKERVIHNESGFCADSNQDFIDYALMLANDKSLRLKFSNTAKERADSFKIVHWIDKIIHGFTNSGFANNTSD